MEQDEYEKPPVSLSATAREAWKDAPKALKAEIVKRERDFQVGIEQHARNAQRALQMDQALAPYQQYFALDGGNPGQSMNRLLQTASGLAMGSGPQKAQLVAGLIQQFGVDINTLDALLAGKPAPAAAQPQPQRDPELDDLRQFAQQIKQQQAWAQQQSTQVVQTEVQQFANDPKNEFYRDVQADMADILDLAAKRNYNMPLTEAYEKACKLHPEVSRILATRSAAPTPGQRRAASSVKGHLGGAADTGPDG